MPQRPSAMTGCKNRRRATWYPSRLPMDHPGSGWDGSGAATITYPGKSGPVIMMVMYDNNYLYLAIDDPTDNSLNNYDGIGLFFDEN